MFAKLTDGNVVVGLWNEANLLFTIMIADSIILKYISPWFVKYMDYYNIEKRFYQVSEFNSSSSISSNRRSTKCQYAL